MFNLLSIDLCDLEFVLYVYIGILSSYTCCVTNKIMLLWSLVLTEDIIFLPVVDLSQPFIEPAL